MMAISKLKADTSSGSSDIHPQILKRVPTEFLALLTIWSNRALKEGKMPKENNKLDVTMLHKKGPSDILDNYRTLGVGCNICKILARVINCRLEIIVEQSGILGEMQAGFRKGRRASENILILDTIINHSKRYRSSMYVAMLDISKAYDRVDRDFLWAKMDVYGFSTMTMNLLRAMYEKPYGIINFQGIKSTPCPLEIGLKQGCVLSPLLFAIYIAELSEDLLHTDTGPVIDGQRVPAMFYADDMILCGNKRDLRTQLVTIHNYAQRHKIEFSGTKSLVIPISSMVDDQAKWKLGEKLIPNGESKEIVIGEYPDGTYLGITVRRRCNIYYQHHKSRVSKSVSQLHLIREVCRGMKDCVEIVNKVWHIYSIPRILYGYDAIIMPTYIEKKLDVIQNIVARTAMKVPISTHIPVLWGEMDFKAIHVHVDKLTMNLATHVRNLPRSRWARRAYEHQKKWWLVDEDARKDQNQILRGEDGEEEGDDS